MALAFTLLKWISHRRRCVLTDGSSKSPEGEFYWIDLHIVPIPEPITVGRGTEQSLARLVSSHANFIRMRKEGFSSEN